MKLGSGSFGSVTRSRKTGYVTKKYRPSALNSAVREIGILRYLGQHPNIVQLINVTREAIILEYGGQSLREYLSWGQRELNSSIIADILAGLRYIHDSGTTHRDIKPENILWNGANAMLCDLGVARIGNDYLTYQRAAYSYCAPEICTRNHNYDTGIDIWAVACVIVEMEHGNILFDENDVLMATKCNNGSRYTNIDAKLVKYNLPGIIFNCFGVSRPSVCDLCAWFGVDSGVRVAKKYQYRGNVRYTEKRREDVGELMSLARKCDRKCEIFCLSVNLYDEIKFGSIIEDYVQKPVGGKAAQSNLVVKGVFHLAALYYRENVVLDVDDLSMVWTILGWNLQLEQTLLCHVDVGRELDYYYGRVVAM